MLSTIYGINLSCFTVLIILSSNVVSLTNSGNISSTSCAINPIVFLLLFFQVKLTGRNLFIISNPFVIFSTLFFNLISEKIVLAKAVILFLTPS